LQLMTLIAFGPLRPSAAQTAPSFQIIDIPLLTGAKANHPSAINGLGQVAGVTSATTSNKSVALGWVWTPALGRTPAKIETLSPTAGFGSSAADINDAGTVVGTSSGATLWLQGQYAQPVDLNADPLKEVYLPGWTLQKAVALSNPGADGSY